MGAVGPPVLPFGVAVNQLVVGERAPDFALPDHSGTLVSLSAVLVHRHVLVVFNLGFV